MLIFNYYYAKQDDQLTFQTKKIILQSGESKIEGYKLKALI